MNYMFKQSALLVCTLAGIVAFSGSAFATQLKVTCTHRQGPNGDQGVAAPRYSDSDVQGGGAVSTGTPVQTQQMDTAEGEIAWDMVDPVPSALNSCNPDGCHAFTALDDAQAQSPDLYVMYSKRRCDTWYCRGENQAKCNAEFRCPSPSGRISCEPFNMGPPVTYKCSCAYGA